MIVPAPAKLNLFLHVVGRRGDGYHELESLMLLLEFGDMIELKLRGDGRITRSRALPTVAPEDDLCLRAAQLVKRESRCPLGVDIAVDKRIPLASGMGGGSSDAAATLLALNVLWELGLARATLLELAAQLGADVPFFVFGRAALARGIGEQLGELTVPPLTIAMALPPVAVPTASVFGAPDLRRNTARLDTPVFGLDFGRNDLQEVAASHHPQIGACLDAFERAETGLPSAPQWPAARMTGSGSCTFRVVADSAEAQKYCTELGRLAPAGTRCFLTRTIARHPLSGLLEK